MNLPLGVVQSFGFRLTVTLCVSMGLLVSSGFAQERDSLPGVSLGLVYENQPQPALAIQPFTGRFGGADLVDDVEVIVGRDLRNSDRFEVMDSTPTCALQQRRDVSRLVPSLGLRCSLPK